MDTEQAEQIYTFVGVREDGEKPIFELCPCGSDIDAVREAVSWLEEHRSCARAEIWRDDQLTAEVARRGEVDRPTSAAPLV